MRERCSIFLAMRCSYRCDVYQFLTMRCLGNVLTKTLPYDVFDDVLKSLNIVRTMHISDVFMTIPQWNQEVQVHPMNQAFQSKY